MWNRLGAVTHTLKAAVPRLIGQQIIQAIGHAACTPNSTAQIIRARKCSHTSLSHPDSTMTMDDQKNSELQHLHICQAAQPRIHPFWLSGIPCSACVHPAITNSPKPCGTLSRETPLFQYLERELFHLTQRGKHKK